MIHDVRPIKLTGNVTASVSEGNGDVMNTVRCGLRKPWRIFVVMTEGVYQTQFKSLQVRGRHHFLVFMGNQPGGPFSALPHLPMKSLIAVFSQFLFLFFSQPVRSSSPSTPRLHHCIRMFTAFLIWYYWRFSHDHDSGISPSTGHQTNRTLSCLGAYLG